MSETDWFSWPDPQPMLALVLGKSRERKLRLFACACCRRIWDLLGEPCNRAAVEVAERFADGVAHHPDRVAAYAAAAREAAAWTNCCGTLMTAISYAVSAAAFTVMDLNTIHAETAAAGERVNDLLIMAEAAHPDIWPELWTIAVIHACYAASCAAIGWGESECEKRDGAEEERLDWEVRAIRAGAKRVATVYANSHPDLDDNAALASRIELAEKEAQSHLLRDIFGNPFRTVSLDPWQRTASVVSLAQAAYEERIMPSGELDCQRLSVLADALEDAGSGDVDILGHLRGAGLHVRGCWAVDLCLGLT